MPMTKQDFKDFNDSDVREYEVQLEGVWKGKKIFVKPLSGNDRSVMIKFTDEKNADAAQFPSRMCCLGICNAEGELEFNAGDYGMLMNLNAGAIDEIGKEIMRISGMSEESVEEMEGNSDGTRRNNSGTS